MQITAKICSTFNLINQENKVNYKKLNVKISNRAELQNGTHANMHDMADRCRKRFFVQQPKVRFLVLMFMFLPLEHSSKVVSIEGLGLHVLSNWQHLYRIKCLMNTLY